MSDPAWTARPLLPLRDIVLFPGTTYPLFVGRAASMAAVRMALGDGGPLLLATQRRSGDEAPRQDDLHAVGVLAEIVDTLHLPDGTLKILAAPSRRAAVGEICSADPCLRCRCRSLDDVVADASTCATLARRVRGAFSSLVGSTHLLSPSLADESRRLATPAELADVVAAHLTVPIAARQVILEAVAVDERLRLCLAAMGDGVGPAPSDDLE